MLSSQFLKEYPEYQQLKDQEFQLPSVYSAAVKQYVEYPTCELLENRLQKVLLRDDVEQILQVTQNEDQSFKVALAGDEMSYLFRIEFKHNLHPDAWSYEAAEYRQRYLLEDERMEMQQSPQIVECLAYLDLNAPQQDTMIQLAVLDAVAGECYAVVDEISSVFFGGTWLAEMAISYTPPNPEVNYIIHAVSPETPEEGYWLHTHGLLKYGLPELEILQVKQNNIYICQYLIQTLALQLIDNPELWLEEKCCLARSEQEEIWVRFMPWQQAITSDLLVKKKGLFRKKVLPFNGDTRDRDDEMHDAPSIVLFANINDQVCALNDYGDTLDDETHIVRALPNSETIRMSALAQEKFALYQQCFQANPPEVDKWHYIIKFACTSEQTGATEHMWFEVLSIEDKGIQAKLANTPFEIPEMQMDEIYFMPSEQITDWIIYSTPLKTAITPDSVFELRRYLNRH